MCFKTPKMPDPMVPAPPPPPPADKPVAPIFNEDAASTKARSGAGRRGVRDLTIPLSGRPTKTGLQIQ